MQCLRCGWLCVIQNLVRANPHSLELAVLICPIQPRGGNQAVKEPFYSGLRRLSKKRQRSKLKHVNANAASTSTEGK